MEEIQTLKYTNRQTHIPLMSPDNAGQNSVLCYFITFVFRLDVYVNEEALDSHVTGIRVKFLPMSTEKWVRMAGNFHWR